MKKSKLIIDYQFDFELFGVVALVKGYKLAWEINQKLGIQLVKQPDLVVGFKNNEEKNFSFYSYETEINRLKLFKNKPIDNDSGKYYLTPEFPHFDFIILADMKEHFSQERLIDQLKRIPSAQLISSISTNTLKSKSNFVF